MTFGEILRSLRNERKLSLTKLPKEIGISRQVLSNYENGTVMPNIAPFTTIADYFNVSADYLHGRDSFANICHDKKSHCIYLPEGLSDGECSLIKEMVNSFCKYHMKGK
jgi:transcriptional regulator with XRE-family HTH domain